MRPKHGRRYAASFTRLEPSTTVLSHSVSQARFDTLLGPKLRGAQHLDRLLPHLDFFALMSSMASFLPHSGQAITRPRMRASTLWRRIAGLRGLQAISIGWGPWEDTA